MPVTVTLSIADTYTVEDDGIRGNGISVVRNSAGVVVETIIHPADAVNFTATVSGVNLVFNVPDSFGMATITVGSLTDPAQSPDSIVVKQLRSGNLVTLVSNGSITEGGSDAAADLAVNSLIMSAVTGIGTAANAIETQTGLIEAETENGGINIANFGNLQIGGLSDAVDGLDVFNSGNLTVSTVGFLILNDTTGPENVHGGDVSGNVTLTALGADSDLFSNVDRPAISAPGGGITLTAGRDIAFGLAGVNFNNDVLATTFVDINAGRDFLLDGQSNIRTGAFGGVVGGPIDIQAGRNITLSNTFGGLQSIEAFLGSVTLTTGPGGTYRQDAAFPSAVQSSHDIFLNADKVLLNSGGLNTTGIGTVAIRPVTPGRAIDLGSVADLDGALSLSEAEIDRLFTINISIGDANSGPVEFSAPISPNTFPTSLVVRSGTEILVRSSITLDGSLTLIGGDDLIFTAAGSFTTTNGGFTGLVDQAQDDGGAGGIGDLGGTINVTTTVTLSGDLDNDRLNGGAQADILIGLAGNDRLDGNGGDDFLIGGLGADRLIGDGGIDTVDYTGNFGAISVNLTTNLGQFNFAEGDIYSEIENVNGTEFSDVITGSAVVNVLNGNGGNDRIKGNAGADIMNGGLGIDTADYSGNFGAVSIDLAAGTGQFNFAQGDVLTGFENVRGTEFGDTLTGTAGANRLEGNGGNDKLVGGNGDDELIGGDANDNLIGGLGGDVHDGGAGVDTANYSGNFGAVSVNLFTGVGLSNYAQGDTYISIEKVIGTDFNDIFESNGVTNVFTGGLGNDTFIFRPGFSEDIITDFDGNGAAAGDVIRFRTGVFTDFADLLASASQQGADVVIEADPANILILKNVLLGDLHSSDFIFG